MRNKIMKGLKFFGSIVTIIWVFILIFLVVRETLPILGLKDKRQNLSSDFESYFYSFENSKDGVIIIYDKKTGCQYLSGANDEKILVVNSDGSPYITKKNENFTSRFRFIGNAEFNYIVDTETGCQYITNTWGDPYCYRYDSNGNIYVEK